ncbi:MAG: bifunctional phosphoribosylaminoimidazolecarboxamide formyltransferase/IMP cyclohydrolase [Thermodesulfobacteriota bacterium]
MKKVQRAIISVTDKTGVAEFARGLSKLGVEIISTGGTAKLLVESGIKVIPIDSYTNFPEMLDGRLKTLHPKIHGGILAVRDNPQHKKETQEYEIPPIDMVVVNLYAFEKTIAHGATLGEAIENIDIGGPTMIRAAAKNYKDVAVVVEPTDYSGILEELQKNDCAISSATRFTLAKKVFQLTARYDGAISNYLGTIKAGEDKTKEEDSLFPETYTVQYEKISGLRYGENPHQKAAFYRTPGGGPLADAIKLHGKELSYNNIADLDAAVSIAAEFTDPAAVIIKHSNPCGAAVSDKGLLSAYEKAYSTDSQSAFGGIVCFNREVPLDVATKISEIFVEAVIAPAFTAESLEVLTKKKNIRLLTTGASTGETCNNAMEIKLVSGGVLLQTPDRGQAVDMTTVTEREPTEKELADILFAWKICRHVKSNAIVLAADSMTLGVGAGQMSRIDSTRIALMKAAAAKLEVKGCAFASDAFFPFRDNVDLAAENGIKAIIQPGGSIRDEEVIKAANEHGIAMVFTRMRHFRH